MATYTYDGIGAARYGGDWYYRYNLSKYPNYSGDSGGGGDCANFVSQCIHEGGGIPMKNTGGDSDRTNYKWNASASTASQAWRGAGSLRRHIKYGTTGQKWNYDSLAASNFAQLRPGDLVFKLVDDYNGNRNADVTHVGIVNLIDGQNIWTFEHSPATYRIWPFSKAQTVMYKLNSCEVTSGGSSGSGYSTWQEKYGNNTFVQSSSYSGNAERWQTDVNKWYDALPTKPTGVSRLVVDGKYGANSIKMCKAFQKAIGVSQTGYASPSDKPSLFNMYGR